ncbi:MAG: hypothetical protein ACTSYD_10460 [Candidatus Heimdallarchaeaceae archaeon]
MPQHKLILKFLAIYLLIISPVFLNENSHQDVFKNIINHESNYFTGDSNYTFSNEKSGTTTPSIKSLQSDINYSSISSTHKNTTYLVTKGFNTLDSNESFEKYSKRFSDVEWENASASKIVQYPTSHFVPETPSIYKRLVWMTDFNQTMTIEISINETAKFLSIDGGSQSSAISVSFNITSPSGADNYYKITDRDHPCNKIYLTPESGTWKLNITKQNLGNITVWIQITTLNNGICNMDSNNRVYKSLSQYYSGQAQFIIINVSDPNIEPWFEYSVYRLGSSGTVYRTLYSPSLSVVDNSYTNSFYSIHDQLENGTYLLKIFSVGGSEIYIQLHFSTRDKTIFPTSNSNAFNETVQCTYKYELFVYNITITQPIKWLSLCGATQSTTYNNPISFWIYKIEGTDLIQVISFTSDAYYDIFSYIIYNPLNSYLLIVKAFSSDSFYTISIDWETSVENRNLDPTTKISFERSGLAFVKTVNVTKDDVISFSIISNSDEYNLKIYDSNFQLLGTLSSNNKEFPQSCFSPFENETYTILICGSGRITSDTPIKNNYAIVNIKKLSEADLEYNSSDVLNIYGDYAGCLYMVKVNMPYNQSRLVSLSVESEHPYNNSQDTVWKIYQPGAKYIALHFDRLSLNDYYDKLYLYDKYNTTLTYFRDTQKNNFWTGYYQTDTIYIRLVTGSYVNDWGFKVDKIYYLTGLSEKPKKFLEFIRNSGDLNARVYSSNTLIKSIGYSSYPQIVNLNYPTTYVSVVMMDTASNITLKASDFSMPDFNLSAPARIRYTADYKGDSKLFSFKINSSSNYLCLNFQVPAYTVVYLINPLKNEMEVFSDYYTQYYTKFYDRPIPGIWYIYFASSEKGYSVTFTILTSMTEDLQLNEANKFYNCYINNTWSYYSIRINNLTDWAYASFGGLLGSTTYQFRYVGEPSFVYLTDSSWKSNNTYWNNWNTLGFDDSEWSYSDSPHQGNEYTPYWSVSLYNSKAKWIWSVPSDSQGGSSYFRKTFDLVELPQKCYLYLTAMGKYYIYVNGEYLGYKYPYDVYIGDITQYLQLGKNVIAISVAASSGYDGLFGEILGYPLQLSISSRSLSSNYFDAKALLVSNKTYPLLVYISGYHGANISVQFFDNAGAIELTDETNDFLKISHTGDAHLLKLNQNYDWSLWFSALQNGNDVKFLFGDNETIIEDTTRYDTGDYIKFQVTERKTAWMFITGRGNANISFNLITNNTKIPTLPHMKSLYADIYGSIYYYMLIPESNTTSISINMLSDKKASFELFYSNSSLITNYYSNLLNPIFYKTYTVSSYLVRIIGDTSTNINVTWNLNETYVTLPYNFTIKFQSSIEYYTYVFYVNLTDYLCFNFTNLNSYDTVVYIFTPSMHLYKTISFSTANQQYNYQIKFPYVGNWRIKIIGQATATIEGIIKTVTLTPSQLPIRVTFIEPTNFDYLRDIVYIEISASCKFNCPNSSISGFLEVQINDTGYNEWYTLRFDEETQLFHTYINFNKYPDGYATITAVFQDEEGHIGANSIFVIIDNYPDSVHDWNLYVDNNPPSIIPIAPTENGTIVHGIYTLKFEITDYTNVTYAVISFDNGSNWYNLTYNPQSGYYEYVWDTASVITSQITINCSDFWGNFNNATFIVTNEVNNTSAMLLIIVDNTPPQLEMINPAIGSTISGSCLLQFRITDISNISLAQISLDNGSTYNELNYNITTGFYEYLWNTKAQIVDTIKIKVADEFYNYFIYNIPVTYVATNDSLVTAIVVDNAAPMISVSKKVIGVEGTIYLEVTDLSPILSVSIGLKNGTMWNEMNIYWSNENYTYEIVSYDLNLTLMDTAFIIIKTEDIFGNTLNHTIYISYLGTNQQQGDLTILVDPKPVFIETPQSEIEEEWSNYNSYYVKWHIKDNENMTYSIYYSDNYTKSLSEQILVTCGLTKSNDETLSFELTSLPYNVGFLTLKIVDAINQTITNTIKFRLLPLEPPELIECPDSVILINSTEFSFIRLKWKFFDYSEMQYTISINTENNKYRSGEIINYNYVTMTITKQLFYEYQNNSVVKIIFTVVDSCNLRTSCVTKIEQRLISVRHNNTIAIIFAFIAPIPAIVISTYFGIKNGDKILATLNKAGKRFNDIFKKIQNFPGELTKRL